MLLFALLFLAAPACVWKSDFVALQEKQRATAAELGAAQEQVAQLIAQKAALEGDLERTTQQLQQQIAKLEETLAERQRDSAQRLEALKGDLEEAQRTGSEKLAQLQGDYNAAKEEAAKQIATTEKELAAARQQAEAAKAQIAQLTETYDALVGNLQEEISDKSVRISRLKDQLKIDLVDKILFDSGSAEVNPRGRKVLEKVAKALKDMRDRKVVVEGHTDNAPIREGPLAKVFPTNWELSSARAIAVVRLLQEYGVPPTRLEAAAYGPYRPVASNKTPEGRSQNRRIEIVLQPLTGEDAEREKSGKK